MLDVYLHPGRDRSVRRQHPWLMSGAVARVVGSEEPGAWARVISAEGEVLGFGHYSPTSQIRVRLLHFGKEARDEELLEALIARALARREARALFGDTDALRLVNAEGDGLPGLSVDRYSDTVVFRISSAGMWRRRAQLADGVQRLSGALRGYQRCDAVAARREGFAQESGVLWGDEPPTPLWIREGQRRYAVDVVHGQKTGFYLDQRSARQRVEELAAGRRVLDLYAYTGGFAVAAARGGAAAVTLVESSAPALQLAETNWAANALQAQVQFQHADVFSFLKGGGEDYDLLVIDPPPLAKRRSDVSRAARLYQELVQAALRRAAPNALVWLFSCSHYVDALWLRKIAFTASQRADRFVQCLAESGAPADHPVSLNCPEGQYLSGLLLCV